MRQRTRCTVPVEVARYCCRVRSGRRDAQSLQGQLRGQPAALEDLRGPLWGKGRRQTPLPDLMVVATWVLGCCYRSVAVGRVESRCARGAHSCVHRLEQEYHCIARHAPAWFSEEDAPRPIQSIVRMLNMSQLTRNPSTNTGDAGTAAL